MLALRKRKQAAKKAAAEQESKQDQSKPVKKPVSVKSDRKDGIVTMTGLQLYNEFQNVFSDQNMVILDVRSQSQFEKQRIRDAINISIFDDTSMDTKLHFLKSSNPQKLKNAKNKKIIICGGSIATDDNDDVDNVDKSGGGDDVKLDSDGIADKICSDDKVAMLHQLCKSQKLSEYIRVLIQPLSLFFKQYSFLTDIQSESDSKDDSGSDAFIADSNRGVPHPHCIIEDRLYLGDAFNAASLVVLNNLRITHIVNATDIVPNSFEHKNLFTYLRICISDMPSSDIGEHFNTVFDFVDKALTDEKSRILIHCQMGVSRSATLVIAYLMHRNKVSFKEALEDVQSKREFIDPNKGFREKLRQFEATLFPDKS